MLGDTLNNPAEFGVFLFGRAVSVSSDIIAVNALQKAQAAVEGGIYIYYRNMGGANNWGFVKKIPSPDFTPGDNFSHSQSLDGNTLIVGAFDSSNCEYPGWAYIFEKDQGGLNQWGKVKRLQASDAAPVDAFGATGVSISGSTAVVGAYNGSANGVYTGSAYIFSRNHGGQNNWGQLQEINPPDGIDGGFGCGVSVDGTKLMVGDPRNSAVFFFSRDQALNPVGTWFFKQKIKPLIFIPRAGSLPVE